MARTIGSHGPRTAAAIREAGTRLIYEHGFEAMSLRQLAAEVGLQPGSLYRYFDTKQALLFEIVRDHMDDLMQKLSGALASLEDPADRLTAVCAFHLRYHMSRRMQVFIANSELRSFSPQNRAAVVALRARYERVLEDILEEGWAAGQFRVMDVKVTAFALIAMLTGICQWYRADGPLDPETIVKIHTDLVMRGLSCDAPSLGRQPLTAVEKNVRSFDK
jgi:AcrR family transcriptional regulator